MYVPREIAQNIVEEMKKIINQEINYFDKNAIIIASTDENRLGRFHGGARKVLDEKTDLIIHYDNQYEGAKKGINVPVYFVNEIVGVIGITGEKEDVEKYGMIIQRMTEILIKEAYLIEQDNIQVESTRKYIEDLLFSRRVDDKLLKNRGDILGIDTSIPRIVVLSKVFNEDNEIIFSPIENEKILGIFKKHIRNDKQNLMVQSGTNIIMILRKNTIFENEKILEDIYNEIRKNYKANLYFGIGEVSNSPNEIKRSYKEAKKALDINIAFRKQRIIYYKDLDLGLIINNIPEDVAMEYTNKVFKNLEEDDIREYKELIDCFIKHNGSIKATSQELFIHKNTLQYRLNKLKELTGYDPRSIDGIIVLFLSFLIYQVSN